MSNSRLVTLGVGGYYGFASGHWAVQVGQDGRSWYEVGARGDRGASSSRGSQYSSSASMSGSKTLRIERRNSEANHFASNVRGKLQSMGWTTKTDAEIDAWLDDFERAHPGYDFLSTNCQYFAKKFIEWLTEGRHDRWPLGDAGKPQSPRESEATGLRLPGKMIAQRGSFEGHNGPVALRAAGPRAALHYPHEHDDSFDGVAFEASLGEVRMGLGPASLALQPNLNTGVRTVGGSAEVTFLGFGIRGGPGGWSIRTPLGLYERSDALGGG